MPFAATQADSSHVQSEDDKENNFIKRIQHIRQQVHDILDRANVKYKQRHDQFYTNGNVDVESQSAVGSFLLASNRNGM